MVIYNIDAGRWYR